MKNTSRILVLLVCAVFFLSAGSVSAATIGDIVGSSTNITGWDGENVASSGWYGPQEDQEVEYGMVQNQVWDLEAIFWNSSANKLYIVGGFNFATETSNFAAGDVFLFGNTDEYVLDFSRSGNNSTALSITNGTGNFNLYSATKGGLVTDKVYYPDNYIPSNPYARTETAGNGTLIDNYGYNYYSGISDGLGITGGTHYILGLDLSGMSFNPSNYQVHTALECGNDAIKSSVPEPATMLLFGTCLIGLAGLGRKRFIK